MSRTHSLRLPFSTGLHAWNPYRVLNRATPPKRGPPDLLSFCAWTQHRSRYPFRTYARLALFVALLSVVNALLTSLVQNVVGDFNLVFDTVIALGMIGYAFVFALIFWGFDSTRSIGCLLGAKYPEGR